MSKFKVGDKVRLVKTDGTGIAREDLDAILSDIQEIGYLHEDNVKLVGWKRSFHKTWLELVEQNDFQSEQEVWQWLVNGNILKHVNGDLYKFIDGILHCKSTYAGNFNTFEEISNFKNFAYNWFKYVEPQWFENIPEQGILCWVWYREEARDLGIVISYDAVKDPVYPFETKSSVYKYATPASLEEIEKYILKQ